MSATLYRKYRPQNWSEIAGQNHIKVTLAFEVEADKVAHAYLFSGPRGIGKTTIARILARAVNCLDRQGGGEPCGQCEACVTQNENRTLDVIEVDAASHRGIDNVRDNIIENARFAPAKLKYKVFIIDEVHMLTAEAFNALLKTLEEPPAHAIFILATTELHKVPVTIVSRCQRFDFRKIPLGELTERLVALAEREQVKVDHKAIEAIARQADGCLRDAEGLLGKVLTLGDGKRVSYDQALVVLPRSDWQAVSAFVEALLRRDSRTALLTLDDCLESGVELDQFASDAIELLRQLLLVKQGVNQEALIAEADAERLKQFAELGELASVEELITAAELLLEKRRDLKSAHPAQLPLELAVARICSGFVGAPETVLGAGAAAAGSGGTASGRAPAAKGESSSPARPASKDAGATAAALKSVLARAVGKTAAESAATALEEAPAAPVATGVTLDQVKQVWNEFVRQAGEESHSLVFLLGCAEPLSMEAGTLRVAFDYPFHADRFNQPRSQEVMVRAMQAVLGQNLRLEAVTLDKKPEICEDTAVSPVPTAETVSTPSEPAQAAPVTAEAAAGSNPTGFKPGVDALASAFGGRVVE
jgi:DNA polymerase-3 subunit gamma/tau